MSAWRVSPARAAVLAGAVALLGSWALWLPGVGNVYRDAAIALPAVLAVGALVAMRVRPSAKGNDALGGAVLFAAAVLLLEGAIAGAYAGARSHGALIGGRIPYSDASDYLAGASRLLHLGALDEWNSRRPLNATLFATRLALARESVLGALHLQALLLALSSWLAARSVSRDFGWRAGAIVTGGTLVFGSIFAPTTMSECLGLSLGSLAFACLWGAAQTKLETHLAVGGALLAAALSARSGPFFVFVTLLAWAAWLRAGEGMRAMARSAGALGVGVVLGMQMTKLLLAVHHGVGAGAQSNFSYTLYGLAFRGVGWERAWSDHPEIAAMGDARGAALIHRLAIEHITSHPADLALGLWRNVECLAFSWTEQLSGDALAHRPWLQWAVFAAMMGALVVAVRRVWVKRGPDAQLSLATAMLAGVGLSVPVIYMDGRERVFAAAFPGVLALIATLAGTRRSSVTTGSHDGVRAPAIVGLALLALSVLGPKPGRAVTPDDDRAAVVCPAGEEGFSVRLHPGTAAVHLAEGSARRDVSLRTFRAGIGRDPNLGTNGFERSLASLPAGSTLVAAFDAQRGALTYLLFDGAVPAEGVVRGCAAVFENGARPLRRVTSRAR